MKWEGLCTTLSVSNSARRDERSSPPDDHLTSTRRLLQLSSMRSQPVQDLIETSLLSTPAPPEEFWLDILCLPELTYFELRRFSRCRKTHRTLLHT
jgi:hypothetical protein